MQISQENVDQLNAIIRINISPEDYQPGVDKQLREYGKRASMPGFRPGKVPFGMIRKMYGKSALAEELNRLTSNSVQQYIRENGLNILGNPLPLEENDESINFDEPGEMQLAFEIGLAPVFETDLSVNHRFNFYLPKPDMSEIEEIISNYRLRFGTSEPVETAAAGDMLHGILEQLDEQGEIAEAGLSAHVDIEEKKLIEPDLFLQFTGLKAGSMIVIKPSAVFKDLTELANETGSDIDETAVFDSNFRFTVENIHRIVPAELNQELFDKMFGVGKVSSLEEARQFISDEMVKNYRKQSDIRFFNEVVEHLVNNTSVNLPDNFMKKWLVSNSEGKVKPEDVEQNYENYAKAIRWQLIEGKILRDNKISFTQEDVLNKLTDDFLGYMGISQADDNDDLRERARQVATGMLKNEKQVNEAYEELFNQALIKLFYDSFDVVEQELPLDEWVKQIGAPLA